MKRNKNKFPPQKQVYKPSHKKVILCTLTGIGVGLALWLFATRCDNENCFFHYVPLGEVLTFGITGFTFPFIAPPERRMKKK